MVLFLQILTKVFIAIENEQNKKTRMEKTFLLHEAFQNKKQTNKKQKQKTMTK